MPPGPSDHDAGGHPSFDSLLAKERREALDRLVARGLTEADVPRVSALAADPERDIRALALTALRQRPEHAGQELVRRALRDPTDEVRAAAVRLAAALPDPDVALLAPLVGARRWPLTQQTALEALAFAVRDRGIDDEELGSVLSAVAGMESPPVGEEHPAFLELARSIGEDRLEAALALPDDRRLAAVRLLVVEGSVPALRAVAALELDPLDEVRIAAASAGHRLVTLAPPGTEAAADAGGGPPAGVSPPSEIVSGIARALHDPDDAVRERAAGTLRQADRGTVLTWAKEALVAGDDTHAVLAAAVAEGASLREVAGEVLARAAELPPEARGPLVGALTSLELDVEELIALVSAVPAPRRPEAVRLLWLVAGRRALPHLGTMIEDPSGPVRVAVLDVFAESGDPGAAGAAQRALEGDSSPLVRAAAIRVAGGAGPVQRTAALARALDDPDPDVRSTAVELLPQGLGGRVSDLLARAIQDDDDRVWQPAMRHLASLPDRDAPAVWEAIRGASEDRRDHLLSLLERTSRERLGAVALDHLSSSEAGDRMLAVSMASRSGSAEAVRGIIETLADPQPPVRLAAAAALAELRPPEAVPALGRALGDPDHRVREEAVRALSDIDDEDVLDPLIDALKDPEERIRALAGEGLVRWSSPLVARRLVEALTSPALRAQATDLLARLGPAAVDPLLKLLDDADPLVASSVGDTLERLGGAGQFLDRLGSMDPEERLGAVEALGALGGLEAVEGLIGAVSDPNEQVRMRSLQLLGALRDPRAIDAVERAALGDPVPDVAAAAEDALKRLRST